MKNQTLFKMLSNYYALYLKTQSYHWNVTGINFPQLHKMFEDQYKEIASEIDEIAERIRALGEKVPASLGKFDSYSIIQNPHENASDIDMIKDLHESNNKVMSIIKDSMDEYKNDDVTVDFLTQKLATREHISWFLLATMS
jgi:starvation-inducible DNA-binding protein